MGNNDGRRVGLGVVVVVGKGVGDIVGLLNICILFFLCFVCGLDELVIFHDFVLC